MKHLGLIFLPLILTLAACSGSPPAAEIEEVEESIPETPDTTALVDTSTTLPKESLNCIKLEILERCGSEGQSGPFILLLKKFGYDFVWYTSTDNPSTLHFRNNKTKKDLICMFTHLPEGGYTETVRYACTPEQLACFEAGVDKTKYVRVNGAYRRKGSGSYAYTSFQIDYKLSEVTYICHVGKELSVPDPRLDSLYPLNQE